MKSISKTCQVCKQTVTQVPQLTCGHFVCPECYVKLRMEKCCECPICYKSLKRRL